MHIFTFILLIIILGWVFRLIEKRIDRRDKRLFDVDETRLIQELHQGFSRLEDRVEALEAILMEHTGEDNNGPDAT